jgi:hypothetical protein
MTATTSHLAVELELYQLQTHIIQQAERRT